MTWSTQQIDSLPGGVRALPRSLRSAWVGAASSAKGRGSSTADARRHGDAVVELLLKGLAELGLTIDALDPQNATGMWGAIAGAHPLLQVLISDGIERAVEANAERLLAHDAAKFAEPGDLASWLAEQLSAVADSTTNDSATGPDPSREPDKSVSLLDCFRQRFRATVAAGALAASSILGGYADSADRVWRTDRLVLDLDAQSRTAVDKAIERVESGGHQDLRDAIEQLRADGFDDYITPEGYLRIRAKAARDGTQLYSDGVNVWGEHRPEPEVFADRSIKSWDYKPLTNDHPPDFVSISNWHDYAVGVVGQARKVRGADGRWYVEVDIVVADLATLIAIRDGKLELSAGYTANLRKQRGRDAYGDQYEYEQFDIWINHLSLVDRGRAGPLARLSLDGFAWQVPHIADAVGTHTDKTEDNTMPTDKIKVLIADGLEIEMTSDQAEQYKAASKKAIDDAVKAAKQAAVTEVADANKPKLDAFQAQLDGLEAKIGELTTAKAATDAQLVAIQAENDRLKADAASRERAEVIATVKGVCPKLDLDKLPKPKNDKGEEQPVPLVDIKAAAIIDLAPHLGPAIDEYRSNGEPALRTFVDSLFKVELAKATRAEPTRVRSNDGAPVGTKPNPQKVDLNSLRNKSLGQGGQAATN